jgi:hypothetical protein
MEGELCIRAALSTFGGNPMRNTMRFVSIMFMLLAICVAANAAEVVLQTPTNGGAHYGWNTKYGDTGYSPATDALGCGLYFGAPYGNDYTIAIFEIPIYQLAGATLTSANLVVNSLGFDTGYYYGSAKIGWLNTGTATLTGEVIADGLGPAAKSMPGQFEIYNSDNGGAPGVHTFDVLSCIQDDLANGRAYSTYVLSGSRDTYGGISGPTTVNAPIIVANTVPEPASLPAIAAGLIPVLFRLRRRQ